MSARTRRVDVIGVPMDLGADRRGVDMGPSAIRYARLREAIEQLGLGVVDHGNIHVPIPEVAAAKPGASEPGGGTPGNAKHLALIREVCHELAVRVAEIVGRDDLPLILGGDHSIAMGTIEGVRRGRGRAPGVIWVDAHGDINTPVTSPSGNVHGMPLAYALQEGSAQAERTVLIGLRDVDPGEREAIRSLGVRAYAMGEIDRRGMSAVIDEALTIVSAGARSVHVSFDMDGIDPREAPGVGTPVRGGLTYREAHLLMETVAASGTLGSLEITEINPILDIENRTAALAVELITSALGKTVL